MEMIVDLELEIDGLNINSLIGLEILIKELESKLDTNYPIIYTIRSCE